FTQGLEAVCLPCNFFVDSVVKKAHQQCLRLIRSDQFVVLSRNEQRDKIVSFSYPLHLEPVDGKSVGTRPRTLYRAASFEDKIECPMKLMALCPLLLNRKLNQRVSGVDQFGTGPTHCHLLIKGCLERSKFKLPTDTVCIRVVGKHSPH